MPPPTPKISRRAVQAGVVALTLGVFAAVVAVVTFQLRAGIRDQILRDYAEKLAAVAEMQIENSGAKPGDPLLRTVVFNAVLSASKFRGVVGVRVFDAGRQIQLGFPSRWSDEPPSAADWARLTAGEPVVREHPGQTAEDAVGVPLAGEPEAGVEAWVPLQFRDAPAPLGVAQFWARGGEVAAEIGAHDRRLWTQAAIAWLAGSAVILAGLGWAFRRLEAANRALRARTEDLQRANRELVLAAKTSALGTVTAHLMHELKNPLAGLEVIVAGQGEASARAESGGELAAASELTRRLRTMVNDVVGVLRDEQTGAEFELSCADVAEIVETKIKPDAQRRGVTLTLGVNPATPLPGRRANLAMLVLRNLLQNAVEATPEGGAVQLSSRVRADGSLEFLVEDSGPGLPESVRARLFQPCASTKPGGSGIGLALSQQLAQHAGGRIELVRSDTSGTRFRLVLAAEA